MIIFNSILNSLISLPFRADLRYLTDSKHKESSESESILSAHDSRLKRDKIKVHSILNILYEIQEI